MSDDPVRAQREAEVTDKPNKAFKAFATGVAVFIFLSLLIILSHPNPDTAATFVILALEASLFAGLAR